MTTASKNSGLVIDGAGDAKAYLCLHCEREGKTKRFQTTIDGARHIRLTHGAASPKAQASAAETFAETKVDRMPALLETRRSVLLALPASWKVILLTVIALGGFVTFAIAASGSPNATIAALVATLIATLVTLAFGLRSAVKPLWTVSTDPATGAQIISQKWLRAKDANLLPDRVFYTAGASRVPVIDLRRGDARSLEVTGGEPRFPSTALFWFLDQSATQRIAAGSSKLLTPENVQAGIMLGLFFGLLVGVIWASGHGAGGA